MAIEVNAYLKSKKFRFARIRKDKFVYSTERCRMCGKELSAIDGSGAEHYGFVTVISVNYINLPRTRFYAWVCECCFNKFKKKMKWVKTEAALADISRRELSAFRKVWNKTVRDRRVAEGGALAHHTYAQTGWSAEDLVGIAKVHQIEVSAATAEDLLNEYEGIILSAMDGAAVQVILALLGRRDDKESDKSRENPTRKLR